MKRTMLAVLAALMVAVGVAMVAPGGALAHHLGSNVAYKPFGWWESANAVWYAPNWRQYWSGYWIPQKRWLYAEKELWWEGSRWNYMVLSYQLSNQNPFTQSVDHQGPGGGFFTALGWTYYWAWGGNGFLSGAEAWATTTIGRWTRL